MCNKLGSKKRHSLGIFRQGEDAMSGTLIDPDFYSILKENGLPTARKSDGSYWDNEAQYMWDSFKSSTSGNKAVEYTDQLAINKQRLCKCGHDIYAHDDYDGNTHECQLCDCLQFCDVD